MTEFACVHLEASCLGIEASLYVLASTVLTLFVMHQALVVSNTLHAVHILSWLHDNAADFLQFCD